MTAYRTFKVLHIAALCIFIGSIPAHIILGAMSKSASGAVAFATFHQAKYALTAGLTAAGIAAVLFSGGLLLFTQKAHLRKGWMRLKLFLVLMIVVNGGAILTPLAEKMRDMALAAPEGGTLEPGFAALEHAESIAGGINLFLLATVLILTVFKPALGKKREKVHG